MSSPKALAAANKRSVKPVVNEPADEEPQDDDNGDAAEAGGDDGNVQAAIAASGKKMLKSAGKQVSGVVGTGAELVQLIAVVMESFNSLLQDNIRNVQRMVEFKKDMLSRLSSALTNGAMDVLQNVQEIGAEGGRVASGVLRNGTKTAKVALQTGGVVASAPIQIAGNGLKVAKRVASIPARTSDLFSNVAGGVLSAVGVHSEEADANQGQANAPEDVEIIQPPRPKPAAKKGGVTKK